VLQSETFTPFEEQLINQAFPNAQVACSYSAIEVGMIGMRCPYNPDYYHLMENKLGVEILDDEDQPCADGQLGRVVITDYFNRRMPMIRYDIGDMAARGQCDCGKIATVSLQKLIGKIRHTVKHPDGRRLSFADFGGVIRESGSVRQFQLVQNSVDDFQFRFVAQEDTDLAEFKETIRRGFVEEFGFEAEIDFQQESLLKRESSGKFFLFKSMV
jgi:phenylacetate-CoA ligase